MHRFLEKVLKDPLVLAQMLGYTKVKHHIHRQWIWDIWKDGNSTLQAHRGSYKTTCRVISIIWGLLFYPNTRILFIRKSVREASETLQETMSHYERPPLRKLYKEAMDIDEPRDLRNWSNTGFNLITKTRVTKERGVTVAGIGKPPVGTHVDLILPDDIVTLIDRESHAEREATKTYVRELHNILNPDGIGIKFSGTPWHEDDAFTVMPEADKYPADLHFIEDMTAEEIRTRRKKIADESLFQANYYLHHISNENKPFQNPHFALRADDFRQPYAYLDPAFGDKKTNDYTALTIGGMTGNEIFIDGGYIWRKTLDRSYDTIMQYCHAHDVSILFCESNQAQIAIAHELGERGLYVKPITQIRNKHFRIMGYARKMWTSIRFHYDLENSDYLKQILGYIDPQYSAHDDAPDSLAGLVQCLTGSRRGKVKLGFVQV